MTRTILRGLAIAAALTAFGSAAHAFTFQGAQGATGGSALVDPDSRYGQQQQQTDQNGRTVIQNGNTTLQFGPAGGFSSRNVNPDSYFTPNYLMGK